MPHRVCRWIDDKHTTGAAGRRADEIVLGTAKHAARFGTVFDGGDVLRRRSVDHLHRATRKVGNEHAATWRVNVCMVEAAATPMRRQRDLSAQSQQHLSPADIFCHTTPAV